MDLEDREASGLNNILLELKITRNITPTTEIVCRYVCIKATT